MRNTQSNENQNGNNAGNLRSLEKFDIEKIDKKISLNKRKEKQQPCLHNKNIYFKRIKTLNK